MRANLTPNPFQKTLTPQLGDADAVPSPAERARVNLYLGDIEGKGNNRRGARSLLRTEKLTDSQNDTKILAAGR
jgi:hypothetical protein